MSKSEVIFGLVGPIGTDLEFVEETIEKILSEFSYKTNVLQVSSFFSEPHFKKFGLKVSNTDSFKEMFSKMEAGNKVRSKSQFNEYLAVYGISKIYTQRKKLGQLQGYAHVFRSLKHPSESKLLRNVYGVGYYQIGVYSAEKHRIDYLMKNRKLQKSQAQQLVDKDIAEEIKFGQQTRDTFQLSDTFIKYDPSNHKDVEDQIRRFLDLIFGHPHITPNLDEQAMYTAFAYSFRSADLSRQVGAALVNNIGEIIGLGSNDVPKYGGGPYWPVAGEDQRDYVRGYDANEKQKNQIAISIMKKFVKRKTESELLNEAKVVLADTGIFDITEYGRAVHAEMAAILSASRSGVSTQGSTLYCTTFPCHNCAKHIVASGISRVVFVEPYPKSQAESLHGDAISLDGLENKKVKFEPFFGIGARRFIDLFSMKLGLGTETERKNRNNGEIKGFKRNTANLRVPLVATSYINSEEYAIYRLKDNKPGRKGDENAKKDKRKKR